MSECKHCGVALDGLPRVSITECYPDPDMCGPCGRRWHEFAAAALGGLIASEVVAAEALPATTHAITAGENADAMMALLSARRAV
jgi:hypothetical protein